MVDNGSSVGGEQKSKDFYLNLATSTLNEALRIDKNWIVNTLARGTISLMKSALATNPVEKKTNMDSATKVFEEAYRGQGGKRNMFAAMARARILFGNKKYAQALEGYQEVLLHRPDMDPDPRIGIGLCYWALGYKDDAKLAWERSLEIVCPMEWLNLFWLHTNLWPSIGPKFQSCQYPPGTISSQHHYEPL